VTYIFSQAELDTQVNKMFSQADLPKDATHGLVFTTDTKGAEIAAIVKADNGKLTVKAADRYDWSTKQNSAGIQATWVW
jgi:hypothetical protein